MADVPLLSVPTHLEAKIQKMVTPPLGGRVQNPLTLLSRNLADYRMYMPPDRRLALA
jgi:hypothetical protein